MTSFQVRGYTISASAAYLKEAVGVEEAKRIIGGFTPETQKLVAELNPGLWYPANCLSEVLSSVAGLANGDEARTREMLVKCGSFMAREATNTFLRLLIRMLTPTLFSKKLPDLWRRDCTGGTLEVEVNDQMLRCRALDTQGFLHAPCTVTGFITFALQTMGKSVENTTIQGWSLATPNPAEAVIEVVWKD